ncbi:hypothetical protein EW145_g8338, partial [Phellinidium pouzarii]
VLAEGNAIYSGDDLRARQDRLLTLQSTRSVEDVLSVVPGDYSPTLRPALMEVAAIQAKLSQSRDVLTKWDVLKAGGKHPSFLRSEAPRVQMTKEFKEQAVGASHTSAVEGAHKAYLDSAFAAALAAKRDEIMFLEQEITPEKLAQKLVPLVQNRYSELKVNSKLPDFQVDAQGSLQLVGWIENDAAARVGRQVTDDCVVYAYRIMAITDAQFKARHAKRIKKQSIHKDADVAMADATTSSASTSTATLQSLVDKAVAAAVKKRNSRRPERQKKGKAPTSYIPKPAKQARRDAVKSAKKAQEKQNRKKQPKKTRGRGKSGGKKTEK